MSNKKKPSSAASAVEFDRNRATALGGSFVVSLPPCFTDDQIEILKALVDQYGEAGAVHSAMTAAGAQMNNHMRRSRICWLDPPHYKWVYDEAWKIAKKVNLQYQFDIKPIAEGIQVAAYDESEQGCYNWHADTGLLNMRRKISLSIPLSSPAEYSGGELQFMRGAEPTTVLQAKGSPVVFPSFLVHRVTPVTKGRRYSLVSWVGGPSWR